MKKEILQYKKGFTLIEVMLYVMIASVILPAISVFLSSLLESRIKNQTIAEVEQQGLQVMQIITQTTRNATAINSPAAGVAASTLSLNTTIAGNNPTVFSLLGGVILIKEGVAATIPLTNSRVTVTGLTFTNLSRATTPGTINVIYTITYNNPSGRNEYNFSKTFTGSATLRQP